MDKGGDRLPDFLVIGAGKSGTTSLHEYLNQHPQLFLGEKEPNFFAYQHLDPATIDDPTDLQHFRQSVTDLEAYQALFRKAGPEQLLGEVSNTYISKDGSCDNIKALLPQVKLMAILRHPAERLYSRHSHLVREGLEEPGTFHKFFDRESVYWRRSDLINEGFYYQRLKPFFEAFPREHIRIYLYEDFISETDAVVKDVFEFLGVDPSVSVGTDVVYNKSGRVKNKFVNKLIGQNAWPIRMMKSLTPGLHRMLRKNPSWYGLLNKLRSRNLQKPGLPQEVRRRLIDEVYLEDIKQLGPLIGKDLSAWYK